LKITLNLRDMMDICTILWTTREQTRAGGSGDSYTHCGTKTTLGELSRQIFYTFLSHTKYWSKI